MRQMTCKVLALSLMLLVVFSSAQECRKGAIRIDGDCVDCRTLQHVRLDDVEFFSVTNRCPCKQGFLWSTSLLRCVGKSSAAKNIMFTNQDKMEEYSARLLVPSSCPVNQGYVVYGSYSVCVNCRQLNYGLGVATSNSSCGCVASFQWWDNICYCGYYKYIQDPTTGLCSPCSTLPSTLFNSCTKCVFPFAYSNYGCIRCSSLANNGGSTSCCAVGYAFDYTLGACVCDANKGYAIDLNGACTKCGSSDTNCLNCKGSYLWTGEKCVHGSQIPRFNISNGACSTGATFQYDPETNQIIGCACSGAAGYYNASTGCVACTTTFSTGSSLTNCQNCAASAGYYKGAVECISCAADPNSLGTATSSGCNCKPNYFWNSDIGRCQCDFTLGFVGGVATACTDCSAIANTGSGVNPNGCSCLSGYKWNSITKTCDCDVNNPSVFSVNGNCINCASMVGATGVVSTQTCVCVGNYFWNVGTNRCECDAKKNFAVLSTGYCTDCSQAPLSIGLGSGQGCVCQNNFIWSSSTKTCSCPSGYALLANKCLTCLDASFPDIAKCNSCAAAGGYASKNGVCAYCPSQVGVSGNTVVNGACTCGTGKVWSADQGACICDWSKGYVTASTDGTSITCKNCPYVWTSSNQCACGFSLFYLSSSGSICTDCTSDPNAYLDSKGNCVCKSGYGWSQASYPFKCVHNFAGGYFTGSSGPLPCSGFTTPTMKTACLACDVTQGFVLVSSINTCIACSTVTDSDGTASLNGCNCNAGKVWNPATFECKTVSCPSAFLFNPNTGSCDICDPVHSVTITGTCTSCGGIANSLGYVDSSGTACACKAPNTWSGTDCTGTSSCDTSTSIIIGGGGCFKCPGSSDNGLGAPDSLDNTKCGCKSGFSWQGTSIGGSCVCGIGYFLDSVGDCKPCPAQATTTVINSKTCTCANSYVFEVTSANVAQCTCGPTVKAFTLPDSTCFVCDTSIDPNFDGAVSAPNGCKCKNGFTFAYNLTSSKCVCNSPSTLVNGICVSCPLTANTTGLLDGKGGCVCKFNYVWKSSVNDCICDSSVSGIPLATGCFQCLSSIDPNFDGTLANPTSCTCTNGWQWTTNDIGGYCACPNTSYVALNGACTACPSTSTATGFSDGSTCLCKNNYIWDTASFDCICDATVKAVLINSTVCFQCKLSNTTFFDGTVTSGVCNCISGFTPGTTIDAYPTCTCALPSLLSSTGTCFSCSPGVNTSGPDNKTNTCTCINGYTWDSINLVCACNPQTSIIANNGSCFTCGKAGTFTKSRRNSLSCSCSPSSLTWNPDTLMCDCGSNSALIVNGSTVTCSACTSKNNAVGKNDSYSCFCSASFLTWNPTTGKCDCGTNGFYYNSATNSSCIICDASRYATGLASNKKSCACRGSMTWNSSSLSCGCSGNNVIFNVSGSINCQACGPVILSQNTKVSPTACNCFNNSIWVPDTGCVCTGSGAIPILVKNTISCTVCDASIYSSGSSADFKSCVCFGSLKWDPKTLKCGCSSNQVIAISNGQYFCTSCSASNNAKLPIINNNTQCTCTFANLTWFSSGFCGCADPTTQVVGSTGNCITCDDTINSNGKVSPNSTVCKCVNSVLTFNNGVCDCGQSSVYVTSGLSNFVCIKCNNASAYTKTKNNSNTCNCVSANLVWNPASSACICPDPTQIIVVSGKNYTCQACTGQYTLAPNGPSTCSCLGSGLVFTPSASGGSCACPKNYILLPNMTCFLCPNTTSGTLTPYECKCKTGIWKISLLTCQACGSAALPNSLASGGSSLACKCSTGYIWEVFNQTCVSTCAANDITCLSCDGVYSDVSGPAATLVPATSKNLTGWQTVKSAVDFTYTDYSLIKNFQCSCIPGQVWEPVRLRCFNSLLV